MAVIVTTNVYKTRATAPFRCNVLLLNHMSLQPPTSSKSSPTAMLASLRTDSPRSTSESPNHLDSISQENSEVANTETPSPSKCHLRVYTRPQLLSLSQSPMVKPPPDMPDLKTWFGYFLPFRCVSSYTYNFLLSVENENLINKKDEPSVLNSARERRLVFQIMVSMSFNNL